MSLRGPRHLDSADPLSSGLDPGGEALILCGGEPRQGEHTGTKALFLAVLEDGMRDYLGPPSRRQHEAECWVSRNDRRWPFSFVVICETLGLEPEAVRLSLSRMQPGAIQRLRANAHAQRRVPNPRRAN